jgi:uncharacterized membrane protein YbaN (DUF454 family)
MTTNRLPLADLPQILDLTGRSPTQDPSIVHTSYGRLRVHLPHWSGTDGEQIVARTCRLGGVTSAEANPLTGNLLIRFEPEQTSVGVLIDALPALRLEPPLLQEHPATALGQLLAGSSTGSDGYVTGTARVVYTALGWTSVGMAVVGAVVPGIPTAPFVILAGYVFIRSSPEAHEWLRRSRWFGPILRDWEEHRGVRRSLRNAALALIGASALVTGLLPFPMPLKLTILGLQAIGFGIVLQLRVLDPVPPAPAGKEWAAT